MQDKINAAYLDGLTLFHRDLFVSCMNDIKETKCKNYWYSRNRQEGLTDCERFLEGTKNAGEECINSFECVNECTPELNTCSGN